MTVQCSVRMTTKSGTAEAGKDFEAIEETVHFLPGQDKVSVVIPIIDDDEQEDDERFTVELDMPSKQCLLGPLSTCEITIQDDDGPGELHFEAKQHEAYESVGSFSLTVLRTHGSQGQVSCKWSTADTDEKLDAVETAKRCCKGGGEPSGYTPKSGELIFKEGVTHQSIMVPILDTGAYHRKEAFHIVLFEPSGDAKLVTDVSDRTVQESVGAKVAICSDKERKKRTDELIELLQADLKQRTASASVALDESTSWVDQFTEAFEMPTDGSTVSMVMHFLALPWKLIGALVPPPQYAGGWACFGVTLVFIGVLTAFIGDFASHMGCCMGLPKSVTAITFVALGTSLPDTFASRSAAANEPYADASIVNITGSNSVNVFLGLGLPWMIAAFYWSYFASESETAAWHARYAAEPWYTPDLAIGFAVPAGNLAYSVSVFVATSTVCFAVLIARRKLIGFELGGPTALAYLTFMFFVGLWLTYLYLSISKSTSG